MALFENKNRCRSYLPQYVLALLILTVTGLTKLVAAESDAPKLRLTPFITGLTQPVTMADDGSGRLFVVEQTGQIRLVQNGSLASQPFLDIRSEVKDEGECGLLCVVFHPQFAKNGRFFVNYDTVKNGYLETIIAEFKTDPHANRADAATEKEILRFRQPFANHNGGQLAFGADGMLYIAVGDGGSGGDPLQNGQSLKTWLGKILRIDVDPKDSSAPYTVPSDNPFVGQTDAKPEIWAWGLRNPWRFSFDRKTGQLWAGDVGQNKWEEIDIIEKGKNYGWSAMEGTHPFEPKRAVGELVGPVKDYGRDAGQCVIGGYVYRGTQHPALNGIYFYGDFSTGRIWGLRCVGNGKPLTLDVEFIKVPFNPSSFAEDKDGELYVLNYSGGQVLRMGAE